MDIYLVRHTQTTAPPGICYGFSDVPPASDSEMDVVAQKLKHLSSPVVYSSPLQRCRLLAERISSDIYFDNRLKELNFGQWEMQSWNDLRGPAVDRWMNDFVNVPVPGGESYEAMSQRVIAFLNDLLFEKYQKPVVIVTHGGVIRIILARIRKIALNKSFEISIPYGAIFNVALTPTDLIE
ncbi:MAG: alpha-ribazole phosphatase [Bacteroidota bacterium]|nr:alpha-ribazole phosphatase [Bacteroidota bacterium]